MPLDKPEAKMVEARFNEKPFIVAFGVAKKRDVKGAGGVGTDGIKGEIQSQKDLDWRVLYNLKALPEGFMPQERLKDWVASTVSAVSGSIGVFNADTKFIETEEEKLEEAKGRDPQQWLFEDWFKEDYGLSKTKEETKKKKKKPSKLK